VLFNSLPFAAFFAVLLVLHRLVPSERRNSLLLGASLLFYFLWRPPYLLLLLADIAINYALLVTMLRSTRPRRFLIFACVFNLAVLAYYKYAAFLLTGLLPVAEVFVGALPDVPEIVLPLGISFYTFQLLALTIDGYRGQVCEAPPLQRYALFVCFFPQLIAGPILRGNQLLPQLERGGRVESERTRRGVWLCAVGLVKKVVFADFLLAPYVDEVFANVGQANAPELLLAAYSFAFQIYFDFSGYTDMARGLGAILGFELPLNFREPYLSRGPREFWRRWHVTLSQWLRDYLYVPLGGNRHGMTRTQLNLFLTMAIGGLWHGAAWTMVVWGALHGVWLVAQRALRRNPVSREDQPIRGADSIRIALCFHAVCLLWIVFRAPNLSSAWEFCAGIFAGSWYGGVPLLPLSVVAVCAILHGLERAARVHADRIREGASTLTGRILEGAAIGSVVALLWVFSGASEEFIYFQF